MTTSSWHRAVWCLYVLGTVCNSYCRSLVHYVLLQRKKRKKNATNDQEGRKQCASDIAKTVLPDTLPSLVKSIDHSVIKYLLGDRFFESNIKDIAKLESEVGQSILDIFDTHPVFLKYPRLKGLARNKEFEEAQAKKKKAQSQAKTNTR